MTRSHPRSAAGFTIIELMVTIAVVSVLLSLAVPAFTDIVRNTRISNQTNLVVGALQYARSESATRGIPVSICAANAQRTDCVTPGATATNWSNGWLIFTDRTGTIGQRDLPDDELLQTGAMPARGFSVSSTGTFIRFGLGATGATVSTFTVTPTETSVCLTTGRRQIVVTRTGRVNSSKSTCS
jgi:type IV fimbrial biogenesis protein FimT